MAVSRDDWTDNAERVELGLILAILSTTLFGIIGEIGGRLDQAVARGDLGLFGLWGMRALGVALLLVGIFMIRGAYRRLLDHGMAQAEARKAASAWATAGGAQMVIAAGLGLAWVVSSDSSADWRIELVAEPALRPMAWAFVAYGVAGILLFLSGGFIHLRLRPQT
jgi:hypothetical protein